MRNIFFCFITVLFSFLLYSCSEDQIVHHLFYNRVDYEKGKQLILRDTIVTKISVNAPIKIITYFDSLICTKCFANYLNTASRYIESFNSDSIVYICILQPRAIDEVQSILNDDNTKNTYILNDITNDYLRRNGINDIPAVYTTFLLDSNDEIALIGDPLRNNEIRLLYERRIRTLTENGGYIPSDEKRGLRWVFHSRKRH